MKKILVLLGFVLLLTACTGPTTYQTINYRRLDTMLNDKESFVLVLGSATCPACSTYRRTMEEIIREHKLMIYYVNVDDFTNAEMSRLAEIFDLGERWGTPTTLFVVDGQEVAEDRIRGAANKEAVISSLIKYGYIKGDG